MAESAIQRAARALDLVPYVAENPGISIKELATKFHVTENQIIKDLELIFLCGLPGYTPYELIDLTFEDGVVTIIEPQLLDKPRQFSETEAVIINLGLSLLKNSTSNHHQHAVIEDLITKLSKKFKAINQTVVSETRKPMLYDEVISAINTESVIEFKYDSLSNDTTSDREILPDKIIVKNGNYYLVGLDVKLESERTFRMDLMSNLKVLPNQARDLRFKNQSNSEIDFQLVTSDRLFTEKYRELFTQIDQVDGNFHISGRISNREWMVRWILSNTASVELLHPHELRDLVYKRAKATLDLYQI